MKSFLILCSLPLIYWTECDGYSTDRPFFVDKNPLIYHSGFWEPNEQQIRAPGLSIQVNILLMDDDSPTTVDFYDATQSFSIDEIAKSPKIFKDFVNMTENVDRIDFRAAFTSFSDAQERTQLGLEGYSIVIVDDESIFSITPKDHPQAVTFGETDCEYFSIGIQDLTGDCEVALYVSGTPSEQMKAKMLLYTYTQDNYRTFDSSGIGSPFATLVVPSDCGIGVRLSTEDGIVPSSLGSHGFFMDVAYPGDYENYYPALPVTTTFSYAVSDTKLSRWFVHIVSISPGIDGNFTITTGDVETPDNRDPKIIDSLIINDPMTNFNWTGEGQQMMVWWQPGQNNTGFLLTCLLESSVDATTSTVTESVATTAKATTATEVITTTTTTTTTATTTASAATTTGTQTIAAATTTTKNVMTTQAQETKTSDSFDSSPTPTVPDNDSSKSTQSTRLTTTKKAQEGSLSLTIMFILFSFSFIV